MDVSDGELSPGEVVNCYSPFPRTQKKLVWPCKHKFIPPDLEPGELVFISENAEERWKNWYRDVKPETTKNSDNMNISALRSNSASAGFGVTKSLSDSVTLSKSTDSSLASVSTLHSETRSDVESLLESVSSSVTASSLCSVTPLDDITESGSLSPLDKERHECEVRRLNGDKPTDKEEDSSAPTRTTEMNNTNMGIREKTGAKKSKRRSPKDTNSQADHLSKSNSVVSSISASDSLLLATAESLHELAIPKVNRKPQLASQNKTSPAREKRLNEKHQAHLRDQRVSEVSKTPQAESAASPEKTVKVKRRGSSLCIQIDEGDSNIPPQKMVSSGQGVKTRQPGKPISKQDIETHVDNSSTRRSGATSTLTTVENEKQAANTPAAACAPASVPSRVKKIMFRPGAMRKRRSIFGGQSKSANYWTIIAKKSFQRRPSDQTISNNPEITPKLEPVHAKNSTKPSLVLEVRNSRNHLQSYVKLAMLSYFTIETYLLLGLRLKFTGTWTIYFAVGSGNPV